MKTGLRKTDSSKQGVTFKKGLFACLLSFMLMFSTMVSCSPAEDATNETTEATTQQYTPGTYTGTGTGNGGDIVVEVTFSQDAITDIVVVSQNETQTIAAETLEVIPNEIVENQGLNIDSLAGATVSGAGLKMAITDTVEQAGGNVSALQKIPEKTLSTETVEMESDVIVIGGGGAGMSSAIRLDELGKRVILVEKTSRLGGSLSISGGNQVVSGSALQAEAGVSDDSTESMVADFQANGEDICVPELINLYAANIGTTTDWLNTSVDVAYDMEGGLHDLAEYSVDRELAYDGGAGVATESFRAAINASDAEVLLSTTAESLIVEEGKVVGVEATNVDGTTYILKADAVVLATGGYGNADEYLTPELQNALYYGLMSSTGDGLTMATADDVDAATRMLEYAKLYPNGAEVSAGRAKSTIDGNLLVWKMSTILVNPEGERVVNEKASNHDILHVELEQTDSMLYLLMDEENFDVWSTKLHDTGFSETAVEGYLESNGATSPVFAHADTLEELAEIVGMDPEVLKSTVEKYNAGVAAGEDEFGRSGEYLQISIGEGPYYLVEQKPRYATTMGGLVINEALEVLNNNDEVIEGLYAAGEVVGGVMGSNSPSGANNGWAVTSGKLAAEAIVAKYA